jgi:PqqD family protein of HPr-rel-A system
MTIDDQTTVGPIARLDVILQRVGREAILHDDAFGKAHVINGSAAQLWELCDGRPLDELLTAFADLYGRSPDTVADDVRRTLERFRAMGLLA